MKQISVLTVALMLSLIAACGCSGESDLEKAERALVEAANKQMQARVQFAASLQQEVGKHACRPEVSLVSVPNVMWSGEISDGLIFSPIARPKCLSQASAEALTEPYQARIRQLGFRLVCVGNDVDGYWTYEVGQDHKWARVSSLPFPTTGITRRK